MSFFYFDVDVKSPTENLFKDNNFVPDIKYYWIPHSSSADFKLVEAVCITKTGKSKFICKACNSLKDLVNAKEHFFRHGLSELPSFLRRIISFSLFVRDCIRRSDNLPNVPDDLLQPNDNNNFLNSDSKRVIRADDVLTEIYGNMPPPPQCGKSKMVHVKINKTVSDEDLNRRRHNLSDVFPPFPNHAIILKPIFDLTSECHGEDAAGMCILTVARLLNNVTIHSVDYLETIKKSKAVNPENYEVDLVYCLSKFITEAGARATAIFLRHCKENAGLVLLRSLSYCIDYLRNRYVEFGWVCNKRTSSIYKNLKAFQSSTLNIWKHRKQRGANIEEKKSYGRDLIPVTAFMSFWNKYGCVPFCSNIRYSTYKVLSIASESTFNLNSYSELRLHLIGLLNTGLVPSRAKEFKSLRIKDLNHLFNSLKAEGFHKERYIISTDQYKTVFQYGYKYMVIPFEIVIALLCYSFWLYKFEKFQGTFDEYLSDCSKYVIRSSHGAFCSTWGEGEFSKYGYEVEQYFKKFYSLTDMGVQVWRKSYASLVKNGTDCDEELRSRVLRVLAAGGSHSVPVILDRYIYPLNEKVATEAFLVREIILGSIPPIDNCFYDNIKDLLGVLNASDLCISSIDNYFEYHNNINLV
jgi:hypothetical protein